MRAKYDGRAAWKAMKAQYGGRDYVDAQLYKAYSGHSNTQFDGSRDRRNIVRNWNVYVAEFSRHYNTIEWGEKRPLAVIRKCKLFVNGILAKDKVFQSCHRTCNRDKKLWESFDAVFQFWGRVVLAESGIVAGSLGGHGVGQSARKKRKRR
jgi:hypothetical protein